MCEKLALFEFPEGKEVLEKIPSVREVWIQYFLVQLLCTLCLSQFAHKFGGQ